MCSLSDPSSLTNGEQPAQHFVSSSTTLRYINFDKTLFFQAVVKISSVTAENLFVCKQSGLLTQFLKELDKDDVLLQVFDVLILLGHFLEKLSLQETRRGFVHCKTCANVSFQLNVLELLKDLAQVHHGIVYLEQEGIVARLEDMMNRVEEDPLMSFLLPGLYSSHDEQKLCVRKL